MVRIDERHSPESDVPGERIEPDQTTTQDAITPAASESEFPVERNICQSRVWFASGRSCFGNSRIDRCIHTGNARKMASRPIRPAKRDPRHHRRCESFRARTQTREVARRLEKDRSQGRVTSKSKTGRIQTGVSREPSEFRSDDRRARQYRNRPARSGLHPVDGHESPAWRRTCSAPFLEPPRRKRIHVRRLQHLHRAQVSGSLACRRGCPD